MNIQTLIIDDEPLARRRLRRLIQRELGMKVAGECLNGVEAERMIETVRPDLIFLDIQMPELDGIGLVERLNRASSPAIVFVTAYEQHAVKAFELNAFDYLLKPIQADRFSVTISRVIARLSADSDSCSKVVQAIADLSRKSQYLKQLAVKTNRGIEIISPGKIDWIEAANNYVKIHVGNDEHLLRATMHELEKQLDPEQFVRIHRSQIVNISRIVRLEPLFHSDYVVFLSNGAKLRLSRTYKSNFEAQLRTEI